MCWKCGEAIVAVTEIDRLEIEVALTLAWTGAHSDDALRTLCKAIGLSATALAELLESTQHESLVGSRGAVAST